MLHLNICGLRKDPRKFFHGVLESFGVLDNYGSRGLYFLGSGPVAKVRTFFLSCSVVMNYVSYCFLMCALFPEV